VAQVGRYDDYGKEMLRITDRHEREMLYGPTNEEMITDIFRRGVQVLQGPAAQPLPHPVEVPRRGAAALRRHARPRVPDEGRLLLRHRREAARHAYNKMFVAYLRTFARMGLKAIPMRADTGPIGGDLSHEFLILAETGESEVFFDRDFSTWTGRPDIDYDDVAEIAKAVEGVHLYAATDEMHDEATSPAGCRRRAAAGRGIEVGHIFFFGTKYSEPMGATVTGPDGEPAPCRWAPTASACRGWSGAIIEASHDDRHHLARAAWRRSVGLVNLKRATPRPTACDTALRALSEAGRRGALRRPRRAAGAKFAAMDLIGLPLAAHHRPARAEGRRGRAQARAASGKRGTRARGAVRP
jgi:prolyl-tRNA synthetase